MDATAVTRDQIDIKLDDLLARWQLCDGGRMKTARRSRIGQSPWGLTVTQEQTMRAVCEFGCNKLAARALGVTHKTIERNLTLAAKRMPGTEHRVSRLIAFDRWDRARGGSD